MSQDHALKLSALDQIDSAIQPMDPQPALRAKVDQLVKSNNVRALVALYDAFAAAGMAFQAIQNRSPADEAEIFEEESAAQWAKAYFVADRLKTLRPDAIDLEQYAATMFNCTIAMGGNLEEAVAVVNEINAWPEIERSGQHET